MKFNFKAYRGDTLRINFAVTLGGEPVDLTAATLYFTAKRRITDADDDALIAKQTGSGIEHTNPGGGLGEIKVAAASVASMPTAVPLYADLQLKMPDGEIYTVASGKLTFTADVTLRTT